MASNRRRSNLSLVPALALLVLLYAAPLPAWEPSSAADPPVWATTATELRDRALSDDEHDTPWQILESLTTVVGPRFAGSPGDKAVVAWGLRTPESRAGD